MIEQYHDRDRLYDHQEMDKISCILLHAQISAQIVRHGSDSVGIDDDPRLCVILLQAGKGSMMIVGVLAVEGFRLARGGRRARLMISFAMDFQPSEDRNLLI